MLLNWIGLLGIQTLCSLMGLVVYAKYFNCDPIGNKVTSSFNSYIQYQRL